MSKKTKYIICFICLFFIIGLITGGKSTSTGYKGLIYHENDLIAKTSCEDELFLEINPDNIVVKSAYDVRGIYYYKEIYRYVNDGKYHVEKKECDR